MVKMKDILNKDLIEVRVLLEKKKKERKEKTQVLGSPKMSLLNFTL